MSGEAPFILLGHLSVDVQASASPSPCVDVGPGRWALYHTEFTWCQGGQGPKAVSRAVLHLPRTRAALRRSLAEGAPASEIVGQGAALLFLAGDLIGEDLAVDV